MNKELITGVSIMFIIMGYQWTIATKMSERVDKLQQQIDSQKVRSCEQEKEIIRLECDS